MKRFLIAPDSFKGTASAVEICELGARALSRHIPDAVIHALPIADGGEGTVDCFLGALAGERVTVEVTGPGFERVTADYAIVDDDTAVIELAAAAGLPLTGDDRDPSRTTTYGVGELISDALSRGRSRIILGLGGSATNDAACGIAAALGTRFFRADGSEFIPVGGTLCDVSDIDATETEVLLRGVKITVMCDVDNPLYGERGAAYIFAPQKGADVDMVELLDYNLRHISEIIGTALGIDVSELPGGGAAGGAGAGCVAFLGAELVGGIDTVLDMMRFEELAASADLIITGEGRVDGQSIDGKAISGIASRARALGVPVAVIAGDIGDGIDRLYDMGVSFVLSTNRVAKDFSKVRARAKSDLELTFDTLGRIIKTLA